MYIVNYCIFSIHLCVYMTKNKMFDIHVLTVLIYKNNVDYSTLNILLLIIYTYLNP